MQTVSTESWIAKATTTARRDFKVQAASSLAQQLAIVIDPQTHAGTDDELDALPVWHRSATTKTATSVSPAGAAILPKAIVGNDALPRVPGWRKILREIGCANGDASRLAKGFSGHVADLLHDVAFQHHQSTNGRWNPALSRWERYGVRSVDGWRKECPARSFHRAKDRLIALGLIDASSHLWRGKTCLWIKPTDELSRILFEPGRWDDLRRSYAPTIVKPGKGRPSSARKARGVSAMHVKLDAELQTLYHDALAYKFVHFSKEESWAIWDRLTKPITLGSRYVKAPFVAPGTSRARRLHAALGL